MGAGTEMMGPHQADIEGRKAVRFPAHVLHRPDSCIDAIDGLAANNGVVEVFASPETGTWTIIVTLPDGQTCLVASGEGYESITEPLPAKGDPA